ncbi:hypothetical protein ACLN6N_17820 (plasmid) [Sphingomonas carotinifaciens]
MGVEMLHRLKHFGPGHSILFTRGMSAYHDALALFARTFLSEDPAGRWEL